MKIAKIIGGLFAALVLIVGVGYIGIWKWTICRKYCPQGYSLLVTRKTGEPAGRDAYAEEGQMGVRQQMAGPGRHFYNPYFYSTQRIENVDIKPGQIAIVKNNIGSDLPPGRFLAGPDEKGTQRIVLTPGRWRVNTHGQKIENNVNATIIKPGYVGVQTLREGDKKGILKEILQPGYYNINPREIRVDIVEIGYKVLDVKTTYDPRTKRIKANTGVSFPLADGKEMYLDFTVVWGAFPAETPRIIREYGTIDMVESKVIVPQVLSICKNIGSNLTTMEFIEGDTREHFQREVTETLQKMGTKKGIHILIALLRGFHPAQDIKETIQARMIAEEEKNTLKIEQLTDIIDAKLEEARKIVDIAVRDFDAQTKAFVATEREMGLKKAAEIQAQADREVAVLARKTAELNALMLRISGQAEADVTEAKRKADATKLKLQIAAFGGARAYNLYTFAEALPKDIDIKYRYAGEGTLWTDSGNSKSENQMIELSAKKVLEFLQREAAKRRQPAIK